MPARNFDGTSGDAGVRRDSVPSPLKVATFSAHICWRRPRDSVTEGSSAIVRLFAAAISSSRRNDCRRAWFAGRENVGRETVGWRHGARGHERKHELGRAKQSQAGLATFSRDQILPKKKYCVHLSWPTRLRTSAAIAEGQSYPHRIRRSPNEKTARRNHHRSQISIARAGSEDEGMMRIPTANGLAVRRGGCAWRVSKAMAIA